MNYFQSREQKRYRVSTAFFTHFPKDRNCDICWREQNYKGLLAENALVRSFPERTIFGDLTTTDHKVPREGCESRHAVVVQDLATQWIQTYLCKTKISQETQKCLQKFLEPTRKPKVFYTDSSLEFSKSCEDLFGNQFFVNTAQIGN